MRQISLSQKRNPKLDFSYVELNESHYDELLNEDVTVRGPDGEIIFIFLKRALSKESVAKAWSAIESWWPQSPLRAQAKGIKQQYKYEDGKKTNYLKNRTYCCSGVMGYFDRFPTIPCCRPCAFNANDPKKFELMNPISEEIALLHKQHDPDSWKVYSDFRGRTHSDWMIPKTPYTTITMNKNFQTWPHKDGKNLPVTCPMTIIRKGKYRGGNLVFPEWRVAVNIDTTDLIMFMNANEWHGNTRITGVTEDYVRASFIWYCRKNMTDCLSGAEEIERIKNMGLGPMGDHDES